MCIMKKIYMPKTIQLLLSFLIAVMILVSFHPLHVLGKEDDFTITDMNATGTITTDVLKVRSGPGQDYDAIGSVSADEVITITGQADTGWYRIAYDGDTGYVSNTYVNFTDAVENNPNDFTEYVEGDSQKDPINYPVIIIGFIIVIVIVIIGLTIIWMKRQGDEDDYEDEDEEYYEEDEDDDEYYEEDEDNSDEYYEGLEDDEDEDDFYPNKDLKKPASPHPKKSKKKSSNKAVAVPPRKQPLQKQTVPESTTEKSAPIRSSAASAGPSNTFQGSVSDDDYRIYVDPRIFEEESLSMHGDISDDSAPVILPTEYKLTAEELQAYGNQQRRPQKASNAADASAKKPVQTEAQLNEAMQKLQELQAEIERLKQQKE